MGKYKSKKHLKKKGVNKNSLKRKIRKTRKNRRNKKGGHEHEDLPHYHLFVKFPSGKSKELNVLFARSDLERDVNSATIQQLKNAVQDEFNSNGINKPFTLFWKGKKLEDSNVKLRQIVVDKTKLPLYYPNINDPIVVAFNEEIGDPINFVAHDLDLEDLRAPQTPR